MWMQHKLMCDCSSLVVLENLERNFDRSMIFQEDLLEYSIGKQRMLKLAVPRISFRGYVIITAV